MTKRALTPTQVQEVCCLYAAEVSPTKIAERFKVHVCTVSRTLRREGIAPLTRRFSSSQILEMCRLYSKGHSQKEIAKQFSTGGTAITYHLINNNTVRRTKSESKRQYSCNHDFFSAIDTEQKAYWLGFIAADGCVVQPKAAGESSILTIQLSIKDEDQHETLQHTSNHSAD